MPSNVYQIYYSDRTKNENDQGFLQLDNLTNERPDWREYWPIRNFLINEKLDSSSTYGFLSPKFTSKTCLNSSDVFKFLNLEDADIFIFSPFFDHSSFFINIFEQAATVHNDVFPVLEECLKILEPDIKLSDLVMNSTNTVFCNFIIAKQEFWKVWLEYCETIFTIAEENNSPLAKKLNHSTNYGSDTAPTKVFVIERIASYILSTRNTWKIRAFNPFSMACSSHNMTRYKAEFCQLDSLKIAYCKNRFPEYLESFYKIRADLLDKLNK